MNRTLTILSLCGGLMMSCSTTRHLPDGDVLYGGVARIECATVDTVPAGVIESVNATLEVSPANALLGSAYRQSPLPFGLWFYNMFYTERTSGLRHWLWKRLGTRPLTVAEVNPSLRTQVASVTMADEGYYGGRVTFDTIFSRHNHRRAKIAYSVDYPRSKRLGNVRYMPSQSTRIDSLIVAALPESHLVRGERFCATVLEAERARLVDVMQAAGYSNVRTQAVRYMADSTQRGGEVALRVYIGPPSSDSTMLRPSRVDSVTFILDYGRGAVPNHYDTLGGVSIGYRGRRHVRPDVLTHTLPFHPGDLWQSDYASRVKTHLSRLNTFRYSNVTYEPIVPPDSVNHLLMRIASTYDYPWTSTLEVRAVTKDNHQTGPGLSLALQRRNLWGGGELFTTEIAAGYEWATGHRTYSEGGNLLNSYEFALKPTLTIPRLQLPYLRIDPNFPVATNYSLSATIMRRSGFFQMFKASGEVRYDFYTNDHSSHSFSPLKIAYTHKMATSARFDEVVADNRVLQMSFQNQFIPKMEYTYTYDNRNVERRRLAQQWLQLTVAEAGGLVDVATGWSGKRRQGERQLLWQPFSQFVKATIDVRNYLSLGEQTTLATRLYGGVVYAYGNSTVVPYAEQFYIGGANSLRGFSIRSVGPGRFSPSGNRYGYMDQTGDIKLEANAELRFPVAGSLKGALFVDAGNVWTARDDDSRSGGHMAGGKVLQQLATDVGIGLRYDLGMLVVRFDVGVPVHDPSDTRSTYYNISGAFLSNLGYHLAVGYPF